MTMTELRTVAALSALLLSAGAIADAGQMRDQLRATYPGTTFTAVERTPVPGLYEVWMGPNVAYVMDAAPRYLVFGHLFDGTTLQDLTEARVAATGPRIDAEGKATQPAIADLPLADAIKRVHGSGERHMALFSDPDCPFCQQQEAELGALDDVTIYIFIVPYHGTDTARSIWCAPDRVLAWRQRVAGTDALPATQPPSAADCMPPFARNLELAARLGVSGTPTLLFDDGRRLVGVSGRAEMEAMLKRTATNTPVPIGDTP